MIAQGYRAAALKRPLSKSRASDTFLPCWSAPDTRPSSTIQQASRFDWLNSLSLSLEHATVISCHSLSSFKRKARVRLEAVT